MNRCTDGQALWLAIDAAIEKHDPEKIFRALQAYFFHKHGVGCPKPCPDCRGK